MELKLANIDNILNTTSNDNKLNCSADSGGGKQN